MAEIRIEGKTAAAFGDHLYLVFVNDLGQEFVIRGGPASDNPLSFGSIVTEAGVPMAVSEDSRPIEDRADFGSQVLDLGGRDAADVWKVMVRAAELIGSAGIDYDALGPNSNSTVASVLYTVGIDADAVEPDVPGINFFPGISNDLLEDFVRSFAVEHTTDADDIVHGGSLDDTLAGGLGDDSIYGGAGGDLIIADFGSDVLDGGQDDGFFGGESVDRVDYRGFSRDAATVPSRGLSIMLTASDTVPSKRAASEQIRFSTSRSCRGLTWETQF